MDNTVALTIDGREVRVPKGTLLWEAAAGANIDIPIFCYHSKLGPVGVCRMCLVQVQGMPKLTTACTTPVADGMVVHTRSPEVEKAQRGILEFLLINHPLDCPICDRGGECPLQDQTFHYGPGVSRFVEPKRHFLKPVPLGPTITLDRERCILCWRCARFTSEVAEDDQIILVDRGSETYISTFEARPYVSNFSGNVIELCPVGALTSSKQRFTFRPWELETRPSICPHCPMGCNIAVDVRDAQEVIRFRSRTNDAVDDGWLCDRGRFGYDVIGSPHRLKTPLIRREGQLVPASWTAAYRHVAERLQAAQRSAPHGAAVAGIASPRLSNEDLFVFKRFITEVVGSPAVDYWPRPEMRLAGSSLDAMESLMSQVAPISALEEAAAIVVIAANPSEREPVMELRVRKAVNKRGAVLVDIGTTDTPLTAKAESVVRVGPEQLAATLRALATGGKGPRGTDAESIRRASATLQAVGSGSVVFLYDDTFTELDVELRAEALEAIAALVEATAATRPTGVIPMLQTANELAARDFQLLPPNQVGGSWGEPVVERVLRGEFRAAYLAGADPVPDVPGLAEALTRLDFLVVNELMLTETARLADVVFPAVSFAEKVATVTNTSRRVQLLSEAVPPPGIARPDWQVLVELSQRWDNPLTYATPEQVLADIGRAIPAYSGLSYGRIGSAGMSRASRLNREVDLGAMELSAE